MTFWGWSQKCNLQKQTIQDELIQIIGDQVLEGIIANVKTAKYFAVSTDEATDRGLQTQLTITLCSVDELGMKCSNTIMTA